MIRELFSRARGWIQNWCRRRRRSRRRAGRRGGPAGPLRFEGLEGRWTPAALPAGCAATMVAAELGNSTVTAFAPDGRVFVSEQGGNVELVRSDKGPRRGRRGSCQGRGLALR